MNETEKPNDQTSELEAFTLTASALPLARASSELLDRVLKSTELVHRFERFAPTVAVLLDIPVDEARVKLARIDEPNAWVAGFFDGMTLQHVTGGPAVSRAITGFVRVRADAEFPDHEHLGQESVLVLQGRCQDGPNIFGPGDLVHMPAGTSHAFRVSPGPDLLYLAVVQDGVRVNGLVIGPDDPRA